MADDRQQTAKESKGIRNRLKKALRLGSRSPQSRSNFPGPSTVVAPPVVTASPAAATPAVTIDPKEAAKLRAKYTRFRILVIGRANAGKTTLLKRVCNTTEEPSIYDEDKNLVSYRLIVILHSHRFFTNSSNRPQRCRLGDFCTYLGLDN
jgi:ATPase subunit of ABC transporter with duplicated ATPase domains